MATDPIEALLRRADRAATPIEIDPAGLAESVVRVERRRRRLRRGAAVAIAAVVVAVATFEFVGSPAITGDRSNVTAVARSDPSMDPLVLARELDRLGREADWRADLAQRLSRVGRAGERARSVARLSRSSGAFITPEIEAEVAARMIVYRADRLSTVPMLRDAAIASYRRTVELFPSTLVAEQARSRLAELGEMNGGPT